MIKKPLFSTCGDCKFFDRKTYAGSGINVCYKKENEQFPDWAQRVNDKDHACRFFEAKGGEDGKVSMLDE